MAYIFLAADPHGYPREKLYKPNGFRDLFKMGIAVRIMNLPKLIFKDIKPLILLSPLIIPIFYLFKLTMTIKKHKFLKKKIKRKIKIRELQSRIEISHNEIITGFYDAYEKLAPKNFIFLENSSPEEWKHNRINLPYERGQTTYICAKNEGGKIIAGATIVRRVATIKKWKLTFSVPIGIITEWFVDCDLSESMDILPYILNKSISKSAKGQDIQAIIFFFEDVDNSLREHFNIEHFITLKPGCIMVKESEKASKIENTEDRQKGVHVYVYDLGFP